MLLSGVITRWVLAVRTEEGVLGRVVAVVNLNDSSQKCDKRDRGGDVRKDEKDDGKKE